MAACPEYEPLLVEKCGGFLSPENEVKLSRHLEGCARCRAEEAMFCETLSLAEVDEELSQLDGSIAGSTLGMWNRHDRRRTRVRAFAAGAVLVAGLAGAFWVHHSGAQHHRRRAEPSGLTVELRNLETDPELEPYEAWVSPEALSPLDADELETLFASVEDSPSKG